MALGSKAHVVLGSLDGDIEGEATKMSIRGRAESRESSTDTGRSFSDR